MISDAVVWHEVECGGYEADLGLWLELAQRYGGPVLDVGSGSGRVSLPMAAGGIEVVSLDIDGELLAELGERAERAGTSAVRCVHADARSYREPARFGLVVAAMQTIQLFGGPSGRARFFDAARENLRPGGALAVAVAAMAPPDTPVPVAFDPDVMSVGGTEYSSRPVGVQREPGALVIERERRVTGADGSVRRSSSSLVVDEVGADELEKEAALAGLVPAARHRIEADGQYLGADVVVFHG